MQRDGPARGRAQRNIEIRGRPLGFVPEGFKVCTAGRSFVTNPHATAAAAHWTPMSSVPITLSPGSITPSILKNHHVVHQFRFFKMRRGGLDTSLGWSAFVVEVTSEHRVLPASQDALKGLSAKFQAFSFP